MAREHLKIISGGNEMPRVEPKKESRLVRFLTWILFLRTSTMGNQTEGKQPNWGFIFVITILFGVVAVAFLTLLGIGGFLWLDMKEDWRGSEAWREKQLNSYKDNLQKRCESNLLRQKALVKIIEQERVKVPPDFLVVEECGTYQPVEKPKDK